MRGDAVGVSLRLEQSHPRFQSADRAQEVFETGMQFLRGEVSITSVKQQIEACRRYACERQNAAELRAADLPSAWPRWTILNG